VGQIKGLPSRNICSRRELDNSYNPYQIRAKGSLPENTATVLKEELLTLSLGEVADRS
jgi:hypothetical protein